MAQALPLPPSRLGDYFARVLAASGVGYLGASYAVSRYLTRRSRGTGPDPESVGLTSEALHCRADDGIDLAGWSVEPAGPELGTVALFHGLRQSSGQVVDRAAALVAAGYRCVAFDFRAHGASSGRRSSFGFYEALDVKAVARYVGDRWPGRPLFAVGLSMGAAAICFAARATNPWTAVVLESLYGDIRTTFASRIGIDFPAWFGRLEGGVVWMTERRMGLRWQQLVPLDVIGDLGPTPVLLVTGTADYCAPPDEMERLRERCRGPAELWLVPEAGHKDILVRAGDEYLRRVADFFDRSAVAHAASDACL